MKINELKDNILNNKVHDVGFLIFQYQDSDFTPLSYVSEIVKSKDAAIVLVDSLSNINNTYNDFCCEENIIYILKTEVFKDVCNYKLLKNTIVICKTISKEILATASDYIVAFPKLESWQVIDYEKQLCQGLSNDILEWLYNVTNKDIYRINNELNKISIFNVNDQPAIFNELNKANNYNDLSTETIFSYLNAICKKDRVGVYRVLLDGRAVDLEATGLVTMLIRDFKNIIKIQFDGNATAEKLNISSKVFAALKYNCINKYSNKNLLEIFKFITDFDYNLKSGNLQFQDNRYMLDYITNKILSYGG